MATEYGNVDRGEIAMDIIQRRLRGDEIRKLCEREDIKAQFIGKVYKDKRPKSEWNDKYLTKLFYSVVAESFNLDFLLYLDEVAEYVKKVKIVKRVIAGVVIILVIVAGVIVHRFVVRP